MKIPGVVSLMIGLAILSLIFALLERIVAALPHKSLLRRERLIDFVYWFFTPWVSRTAAAAAVFVVIALVSSKPSASWFGGQPLALQMIELLIAADLLGYASHRLFHSRPLWRFHAIHHSSEDVDWLAATRADRAAVPRGLHPRRFGVSGETIPPTLLGQLAYPFRRATTSAAADVPQY